MRSVAPRNFRLTRRFFENRQLFDHYRDHDLRAAISHLCMDVPYYRISAQLLKRLNPYFAPRSRSGITVMDYGCGTADYALAFATQGYRVRVVDLDGGALGFARWRLEQRGVAHDSIAVSETDLYPDLGVNHVVLAPEVLEHIRNPLRLLQNMDRSIPPGGFFWTSGYPVLPREVGADHLPEAYAMRHRVLRYLHEHFEPMDTLPVPGFLFRKPSL